MISIKIAIFRAIINFRVVSVALEAAKALKMLLLSGVQKA